VIKVFWIPGLPDYFLGESVAYIAELFVIAIDFVRIVTICTLSSVHLKMVGSPTFCCVNRAGNTLHRVFVKADSSFGLSRVAV
jgi:hypothetical protein